MERRRCRRSRSITSSPLRGLAGWSGSVARLFQTLGASVQDWLHNRAERLRLAQLDERMLSDLGLSRGDVDREYARPFWQPIDAAALDMARRNSGPRLGAMRKP